METFQLQEDVAVLCTTVTTFPKGIDEAFKNLENKFAAFNENAFYGISYINEEGLIIYKAAVSAAGKDKSMDDGLKDFIIPKGGYLTEAITDWMKQLPQIGTTLRALMEDERADKKFPCVEWYKSDEEMLCMVRMAQ